MPDNAYNTLKEDEEIVETLLRLPAHNLETRIAELESQLNQRQSIQDQILSTLGTLRLRVEDRIWRFRYAFLLPHGPQSLESARQQLLHLESLLASEKRNSFLDTLRLREQLQEAREELSLAQERLLLLETAEAVNEQGATTKLNTEDDSVVE